MQRPRLTSDTQGTDCILIDREAHFQSMSSHVLIEYITSCEIQYTTVILIFGDKPRIKVEEKYRFRTNKLQKRYKPFGIQPFRHCSRFSSYVHTFCYSVHLILPQVRCKNEMNCISKKGSAHLPWPRNYWCSATTWLWCLQSCQELMSKQNDKFWYTKQNCIQFWNWIQSHDLKYSILTNNPL